MRKTLMVLTLALAAMTMLASDAFAQRRGGGGRGYGGGGRGYYSRGYYGRGYGGYGYGYGLGLGIWPGYYGGYNPGYYSSPGYVVDSPNYYADPVVQAPGNQVRQSFYPETTNQEATLTVLLPKADAQVWFDGAATQQQGMQRTFMSPALEQGRSFTYTIKGRWMENGRPVERERQVSVQSGQSVTVDLRGNPGENIGTPKSNN